MSKACLLAARLAIVAGFAWHAGNPAIALGSDIATKKILTLDGAKQIMSAAEGEALRNKWTVAVAIVDDGGNLLMLHRFVGTELAGIDMALGKAQTALRFKRPTKAIEDSIAGGRTAFAAIKGITPIQGGVPIIVDGAIIGAIGVSGMHSPQDEQVAIAGANAAAKFSGDAAAGNLPAPPGGSAR